MAANSTETAGALSGHKWRFFRVGGFDQVRVDSGEDLRALDQLDQKLWLALSCPTRGLEFDARTLDLIDTDRDGRIRVPEVLAAVRWMCEVLKDPADIIDPAAALPLDAINDALPAGRGSAGVRPADPGQPGQARRHGDHRGGRLRYGRDLRQDEVQRRRHSACRLRPTMRQPGP